MRRDGVPQRNGHPFEDGLDTVVRIPSREESHVQGQPRGPTQGLQEFLRQAGLELADHGRRNLRVVDEKRTARYVECYPSEGFLHRHRSASVAPYPFFAAEGPIQSGPESETRIFDRVMRVDLEVTLGSYLEPDTRVAAYLVQHVIEERDTGVGCHVASLQIEGEAYRGLGRLTLYLSPAFQVSTSPIASKNASVSSGLVAVTRRQRDNNGLSE